jgi:hypothetical protein
VGNLLCIPAQESGSPPYRQMPDIHHSKRQAISTSHSALGYLKVQPTELEDEERIKSNPYSSLAMPYITNSMELSTI